METVFFCDENEGQESLVFIIYLCLYFLDRAVKVDYICSQNKHYHILI